MEKQYENEIVGFNARMTDIHAAIGRVQLTKVLRLDRAAPGERGVPRRQPRRASWCRPVADGAAPRLPPVHDPGDRGPRRAGQGAARGVQRRDAGCTTRSRTTGCRRFNRDRVDLPETERPPREVLSLPVHPSLSQDDLERIVAAVNAVAKAGA